MNWTLLCLLIGFLLYFVYIACVDFWLYSDDLFYDIISKGVLLCLEKN